MLPCAMSYALEIVNLYKRYAGGVNALCGINLQVKEGDFFALLGPNGAGKSTAIGIITTLVNKTAGQVYIYGIDLNREPSRAKKMLGLVPQEFNFNQFESVQEVVRNQAGYYGIPKPLAKQRAEHYLKYLGLWDKRKSEMRFLSGGMKRRLLIARALVHEPKLLILDEPTAGVDIEVRRMVWKFMKQLNDQGTTIILTTHYLEEAENLCKNIAIIDQGNIIENTSVHALLEKLDKESLVLYSRAPITTVPQLDKANVKLIDEKTLEVELKPGYDLGGLFANLQEQGISIYSIKNKTNRLEELFIKLVAN